jgi:molybdopterin/thiamine biosynthesis adenylyltransferase
MQTPPDPAKLNFGDSYIDTDTSLRITAYHPELFADKWRLYVDGLHASYQAYGVSSACSAELLGATPDTSLFFLAEDSSGNVLGGIRFVGPLKDLSQSATVAEMSESPQLQDLADAMSSHIPFGLIEIKGLWALGTVKTGASLLPPLVRTVRPAAALLGAAHAYASYADRLTPQVRDCGAQDFYLTPVPYPDERYATVAVHFDLASLVANSSDDSKLAYATQDNAEPAQGLLDNVYRPLILDAGDTLTTLPDSVRLVDHFSAQQAQLEELIELPASLRTEPPRLIYYPWSGLVVKLLGPRAFATLRLERNRNKITKSEQARLRSRSVAVVGASAGHAIAYALAQEGLAGTIRVADFDTVELSNLNRIPATVADLGLNKSVVLARRISELDPYLNVEVFTSGVTEDTIAAFLHDIDVVIEECDSLDVKLLVREHAKRLGIPVLMETSDRGTLDVERFDLEPDRPLFHGRLGDVASSDLKGLSLADRGPHVIRIMGTDTMSAAALASLLEVDRTLGGWPQLSGDIALGAATMAAALRRLGSANDLSSGRVQVDLDAHLDQLSEAPYDASLLAGLSLPLPTDPEDPGLSPLLQVVDAARRAPSGGNTQPWRFELSPDALDIFIAPERSTNSMDVRSRGTFIAAGAALFNARVRASALGLLGSVTTFPSGLLAKNVARLTFSDGDDPALSTLNPFIGSRHTNRRPPVPRLFDPTLSAPLIDAAASEGVTLRLVTDPGDVASLAKQIAEADQLRFLLPLVHESMMEELCWPGRDDLSSGLDVRTLEMDAGAMASLAVLSRPDVMNELRSWKAGSALAAHTYKTVSASSALAVLSVTRDGARGYLRGGQGLERFWLRATQLGLSAQPVAPVFLCADSEDDLLTLCGPRHLDDLQARQTRFLSELDLDDTEVLVMVLRLFYADAPNATSIRRPLSQVMASPTPL